MKKRSAGQSTLEYVLVVAVIIGVIVAMAAGPIQNAVKKVFSDSASKMEDASSRFK